MRKALIIFNVVPFLEKKADIQKLNFVTMFFSSPRGERKTKIKSNRSATRRKDRSATSRTYKE